MKTPDGEKSSATTNGEAEDPRIRELMKRMEEIKARPKTGNSTDDFRRNFGDMLAVMDEVNAAQVDDSKDRVGAVLEMLHGLHDLASDDAARKEAGAKAIRESKMLQLFVFKQFLDKVVEDPNAIEAARSHFASMDDAMKRQALYLQRLALTNDAFGILLRGHVLVENALESCIYAYVPRPVSFNKTFFAQKIELAHMLGVIDDEERILLKAFNRLRNKVAHQTVAPGQSAGPDFHITPEHEKELWEGFVATSFMKGDWPEYDGSKFPEFLKYVAIGLHLTMYARAEKLKGKRLSRIVENLETEPLHERSTPIIAVFLTRLLFALGDVDLEAP